MQNLLDKHALAVAKDIDDFQNKKIKRKDIRYRLFRIRAGHEGFQNDPLKKFFEAQLDANIGQTWDTFTFNWDVGATNPFKVIIAKQWAESGGKFDDEGNRVPAAFTKQEI